MCGADLLELREQRVQDRGRDHGRRDARCPQGARDVRRGVLAAGHRHRGAEAPGAEHGGRGHAVDLHPKAMPAL